MKLQTKDQMTSTMGIFLHKYQVVLWLDYNVICLDLPARFFDYKAFLYGSPAEVHFSYFSYVSYFNN